MTRTISPSEFETLDLLARTTSAIRAFNVMITSTIQEGEDFSFVASGVQILLSSQCEKLEEVEESVRAILRDRSDASMVETMANEPEIDAGRLAKVEAALNLEPGTVQAVVDQLRAKPASSPTPRGRTATA